MRRLAILLIALGMIIVAPATASAADLHQEFTLTAVQSLVGVSADGGDIYEGYHYLYDSDGNLVDEGPVQTTVYATAGGQRYTAVTVYDGVEAVVVAKSKGTVVSVVEEGDAVLVGLTFGETIIDAPGFTGRAKGTAVVTNSADGAVAVSSANYVIRPAG